jgi:hypothetical protein
MISSAPYYEVIITGISQIKLISLNICPLSSYILLLIPAQKTKVTEFPDLLALAAWERLYQARLPIAGRVAASGLGNSTRKVGSNGTSLRLWA